MIKRIIVIHFHHKNMVTLDVGIDLGTTNSRAYYYRRGRYEVVDFDGLRFFPSFVCFNRDRILCGRAAKYRFGENNCDVVRNVKRLIGRYYNSQEVQKAINDCGVPVVNRNNKPYLQVTQNGQVREYSPSEISAEILKAMFSRIREVTNRDIGRVLVTVPAYFNANQRTATLEAVMYAGIEESQVTLLNEPTAAAICYGLDQEAIGQNVLVYDLGRNSFDVSILHIERGRIDVIVHDGDNFLGGSNVDEIILDWLLCEYRYMYGEELIDDSLPEETKRKARNKLLSICEEAKEQLSSVKSHTLSLPIFLNNDATFDLTLETLNHLLDDKIEDTMTVVKRALRSAHLNKDNISHVVLVGGSSRLNIVHTKLKDYFGRDRMTEAVNPEECVAKGACMALQHDEVINNKTVFSLGTFLVDGMVECIIPAMVQIPVERTVRFQTASDNQEVVVSEVYQSKCEVVGELEPQSHAISLGKYSYTGFRKAQAGEVHFDTTFRYERDNIVYITVKEVETGKYLLRNHRFEWD